MTTYTIIPFLDQHVFGYKANFVAEVEKHEREDFFQKTKELYKDAVMKRGIITYSHNGVKCNIHLVDIGMGNYTVYIHSYFINFFIGKILSIIGFSLTPTGLSYTHYYSKTHLLREILITTDHKKIFELVKIDFDAFISKKNSIEDIFNLVKASPYFDLSAFKNIKTENKDTQTTNTGFIYEFLSLVNKEEQVVESKIITLEDVEKEFPGFMATYEELEKERKEIELAEEKFNGKIFMSHFPEVSQIALGKSFREMKSKFENKKEFVKFINNTSLDTILKEFKKHSEEFV